MANDKTPSPENKIASAYVEVQTTGVPQVQADLQKVREATEQATGTQVAGQNKVTAAAQKTGGTFADLRAKLNDAQPAAANLMVTLSDLAATAERFYEIGKAIRMFVENSERFARDVQLMSSASSGIGVQQGQIEAGTRGYNSEALKAAGSSSANVKYLDERIAAYEKQLYGTEDAPGLIPNQTNRGMTDGFRSGLVNAATLGMVDPTGREDEEIAQKRKELDALRRQRAGIQGRTIQQSYNLDAGRIQGQSDQAAIGALTSTPMIGEDAMRKLTEVIEENNRLIKEARNRPGY